MNGFAILLFLQLLDAEQLPGWEEVRGGCSVELERGAFDGSLKVPLHFCLFQDIFQATQLISALP